MEDRVFLDTNVLIYAYSDTEPEKKDISLITLERKNIVISTQVINEFVWNMNKKFHVEIELLKDLTDRFFKRFTVSSIEKATIRQALDIVKRYKYSYWDGLIIASALGDNCSELCSEDLQHNQIIADKLRIVNPFEGLSAYDSL
jgi:predicted nucleic acid-binding protein